MTDRVGKKQRSRNMSLIRSKNTQPELVARSLLHGAGLRFRLHRKDLPGTPDLVLPKYRLAVFIHGCFWHGHSCKKGHVPQSNTKYWLPKIERNQQRDRKNIRTLRREGWAVCVIRECEVERGVRAVMRKTATFERAIARSG